MNEVKRCKPEGMIDYVYDVTITGRIEAINDFMSQLCREYQLPHGKGFNVRHRENRKDDLEVSVEVANWPHPNEIHFFLSNDQRKGHWEVYGKPYIEISFPENVEIPCGTENLLNKNKIRIACDETGKYEFHLRAISKT